MDLKRIKKEFLFNDFLEIWMVMYEIEVKIDWRGRNEQNHKKFQVWAELVLKFPKTDENLQFFIL